MADSCSHPAAPPYATILPEDATVRAGDALQVQCLAHGTPPLHYTWDKVNGSLSARVAHRAGLLRLSPAAPADAGTYRCLVTNRVGTAEAFARVAVHGEPIPVGAPRWVVAVLPGALGALPPAQAIPVLTGTAGAPHPPGCCRWVPLGLCIPPCLSWCSWVPLGLCIPSR